MPARASLGVR
ncbi:TPA_asm: UL30 uORF [Human alphaherpesvirus 1]|uniref:Uncharacterized protein n=1 Tax=Human herpesvirus 1 TaxID=10298 RepID=Q69347_HHV1|nr:unknown protein [Human alphaherpesvirus 1]DAC85510.1 TPA_asm: UL30 uORF [Human alphaherpesvirus 1]